MRPNKTQGEQHETFCDATRSALLTFALADDHRPNSKYYGFYHFIAPDPAAVVAATDKFYASDCGKAYPADVGLAEEVFNGAYQSTHFFINTYQNAADQEKAARSSELSKWLEFLADLNAAGVIPTREYLGFALIEEGDWNKISCSPSLM